MALLTKKWRGWKQHQIHLDEKQEKRLDNLPTESDKADDTNRTKALKKYQVQRKIQTDALQDFSCIGQVKLRGLMQSRCLDRGKWSNNMMGNTDRPPRPKAVNS